MTVSISGYDSQWPRRFEREAGRIRDALGPRVPRVEHTGSSAVPGLAAKPVIDILLVVADSVDEPSYVPPLEAAGYPLCIREPDWHEHRMFKRTEPAVNLHVLSDGCQEIERILLFRDRLRSCSADRDLYASVKRDLALRDWASMDAYATAKTGIIQEILNRANSA